MSVPGADRRAVANAARDARAARRAHTAAALRLSFGEAAMGTCDTAGPRGPASRRLRGSRGVASSSVPVSSPRVGFCDLPVEAISKICGLLPHPADVFAVARTCRLGRDASKTAGAWVEVDLTQRVSRKPPAVEVVDLTSKVRPDTVQPRPPSASRLAAFLEAHAGAASGITKLVIPSTRVFNTLHVLPLLRRCVSLRRLVLCAPPLRIRLEGREAQEQHDLDVTHSVAALRAVAASGAPLRHAHIRGWSRDVCDAILGLPSLTSAYLSFGSTHAEDGETLERLFRASRLERLELDMCDSSRSEGTLRVHIASPTLLELEITSKGLQIMSMSCPALQVLRLHGYAGAHLASEDPKLLRKGRLPRTFFDNCPRL